MIAQKPEFESLPDSHTDFAIRLSPELWILLGLLFVSAIAVVILVATRKRRPH